MVGFAILVWFICGVLAAMMAGAKGRSTVGWLVLGLIFGPLAVLGIAIASKDYRASDARAAQMASIREQYPNADAGIRAAQVIGIALVIGLLVMLFG